MNPCPAIPGLSCVQAACLALSGARRQVLKETLTTSPHELVHLFKAVRAAVVGIGNILRRSVQKQSKPGLLAPPMRLRAARLSLSMATMVSKRRKSSARTCRARWAEISTSCRAAISMERGSGGLPMCQAPVPALSTTKLSASPASCTISRKTPSASGDRQMLPRQTKRTAWGKRIILEIDAKWMLAARHWADTELD